MVFNVAAVDLQHYCMLVENWSYPGVMIPSVTALTETQCLLHQLEFVHGIKPPKVVLFSDRSVTLCWHSTDYTSYFEIALYGDNKYLFWWKTFDGKTNNGINQLTDVNNDRLLSA